MTPTTQATPRISRRAFLAGTAATATTVLGRAPAAVGQQVRELQV